MKSLKFLMSIAGILLSLFIFVLLYIAGSFVIDRFAHQKSMELSEAISKQTFNSMYQVMKRGWSRSELEDFLKSNDELYQNGEIQVRLYRSQVVTSLYGEIAQGKESDKLKSAYEKKEKYLNIENSILHSIHPIIAKSECLSCHTNAKADDVLGAIEIKHDLSKSLDETKKEFNFYLIFAILIPLIATSIFSRIVFLKINSSIDGFKKLISSISSVKDLSTLNLSQNESGLKEIDALFSEVNELAKKIKDIAADRELLEFEVRLLDKFIITSDSVKEWKEQVLQLLVEINSVVEAYSIFAIFKVDDEVYDIEIFWRNPPTKETKEFFAKSVVKRIDENPNFNNSADYEINHHIADYTGKLPNLSEGDIDLQVKSLMLSSPKIGGVVGIGVQSLINKDPTRYIVIESILATLINVVGSMKAISKYTRDLEYYATRDPLTNLYNQRLFRELFGYEISRANRNGYKFGLVMIDFDNFKLINDVHGHAFGDKFLQYFAKAISENIRNGDILSRYGGDEFTIILPEADAEQVYLVADKVRIVLEGLSLHSPNGVPIKSTISMGCAIYPDHGKDENQVFAVADAMLYKSKRDGKNRISLPSDDDIVEINQESSEKVQLILNTLENKNAVPFFQPIIDTKTGDVLIHELLMRIKVGDRIVSAYEFIDTAEMLGVVHKLDYMVIEKALQKAAEENFKGMLFINLSPKAIIIGEFIDNIVMLIKKYGLSAGQIVFEITERDTVRNMTLLDKFVIALKDQGFRFAIDDFGSGFSSFHYLKQFPIDFVKIEGEFIRNINKDPMDRAFVVSILTLARHLGIKTIAEYVEDQDVLDAVKELGVDYSQGFFIGTPSPDFRAHCVFDLHLGKKGRDDGCSEYRWL